MSLVATNAPKGDGITDAKRTISEILSEPEKESALNDADRLAAARLAAEEERKRKRYLREAEERVAKEKAAEHWA